MGEQKRPHPLLIDRHQNGDEGEGWWEKGVGGEWREGGTIKLRRLFDGFISFCPRWCGGEKNTFMNTEWHCEVGKGLCVLPGIKTCWYYLLIHPPPLRYPQSQPSLWSLLPGPLTAHSPFDRQAATHPKTTGFYCYGWKLETLFIAFVGINSPVGSDGPLSKSL